MGVRTGDPSPQGLTARQIAAERARQHERNHRRVIIDADLREEIQSRADQSGQTIKFVVNDLIRAAIEYERHPPPPDTPLERRVRYLLDQDPNLTREAAERIARRGGH